MHAKAKSVLPRFDAASPASSQTARATLSLREMILQGRFRPGERIREIPLSARLRLSRIPLRIALERLEHEGLLEVRRTRGFTVPQFSTADVYDAIELRGTLEGVAARLAAERLRDDRLLAPLRESNRLMGELVRSQELTLDDFARYIDLNAGFHAGLITLSGSRMLRRAIEHTSSLPFASPSSFLMKQHTATGSQERFMIAVDQHRNIVEAIANREGTRAETLAREHARIARRNLDETLADRELVPLVPGGKLIKL